MKRRLLQYLNQWKTDQHRKPLLLRGARQVGKTSLVRDFSELFDSYIEINLELNSNYSSCFKTLDPNEILKQISILSNQSIIDGKTLVFIDEIQACPEAIQSLRYFKELRPSLHVIAAGSLLEFVLADTALSMPVGRVDYLYMQPCSFKEFLEAKNKTILIEFLDHLNLENFQTLTPPIHDKLNALFREYLIIGGMPEAMDHYISNQDLPIIQRIQNSILNTYHDDFGKYANIAQHKYLQTVFEKSPGLIGQQISFSKIDPDFRSRELKSAIKMLEYAGIVKHIFATAASGLPLSTHINEKKFKLHFLDIGLAQRKTGLDATLLASNELFQLNNGALAEQAVAQELLAYQDPYSKPQLYYWARDKRNAQAEVDFITHFHKYIIPIEVKSGPTGKLKSLHILMKENKLPLGVKISTAPLSYSQNILNLPIYMIWKLKSLVLAKLESI